MKSARTDREMTAKKAVVDPMLMRAKRQHSTAVKRRALTGILRVG